MSTTSIRTPLAEPRPDPVRRAGTQEFEARWRNPERTFVDYLSAIWVRKFRVVLITGLAATAATAYALTQPNEYASAASVLVFGNRTGANAAEMAVNMLRAGSVGPSQVMSAMEVVNSNEVAQKVVENLGAAEILKPYQPQRATPQEREKMGIVDRITDYMHRLQEGLFQASADPADVYPERAIETFKRSFTAWADERASMIKMFYSAGSPEQAKRILDEVVKVAVDRYREVTAPAESREWVERRTEETQRAFDAAKAELDQFLEKNGRLKFADDTQARSRAVSAAQANYDARRNELDSARKALATFTAQLHEKDMVPRLEREVKVTAEPGELLSRLRESKFQLEQRKIELEAQQSKERLAQNEEYQALLPKLVHVDERIAEVQRPETRTIVVENPQYLALDERVRQLRLTIIHLDGELPLLEEDLKREREELDKVFRLQEQADKIVERYNTEKAEMERWKSARATVELSAQLDSLGLSSLQPVDRPTLPVEKEGPRRGRLILAGLAVGLFGVLSWILVQVRLSRSFQRTSDVIVALGRSDVVGMPWLERGNVDRYLTARRRGWD